MRARRAGTPPRRRGCRTIERIRGAAVARRGWQRRYRCLPRAQPGPERSGGTRPHPALDLPALCLEPWYDRSDRDALMAEAVEDRRAMVLRIRELLEGGDLPALHDALTALHPSDLADLLEALDDDERTAVLRALADEPALAAEALAEMEPDEHPEESLAALGSEQMGDILAELAV